LTHHDLGRFTGATLFDRIARAVVEAGCLPRKELYERGGGRRPVDGFVAARDGYRRGPWLLAHVMLLLDDSSAGAVAVDPALPASAARIHDAIV
jgi:hypothetical protein